MKNTEDRLSQFLADEADQTDCQGTGRVLQKVRAHDRQRPSPRGRIVAFGSGLAAASIAVVLVTVGAGGQPNTPSATGSPDPAVGDARGSVFGSRDGNSLIDTDPCFGAEQADLLDLPERVAAVGPIFMPTSRQASALNLASTQTCEGSPMVVLEFASGISISYEPDWGSVDAEAQWAGLIEQAGDGHIETILGQPALIQPTSEARPRSQIMIVRGDTLIRLLADASVPVEDLIAAAKSLSPADAVNRQFTP